VKNFKCILSLILCLLFIPFYSINTTALSAEYFVEKPLETAEALGLTAPDFDSMVSEIFSAVANSEDYCDLTKYKIEYGSETYMTFYDLIFGNPEFFHIDQIICYYSSSYLVTALEFEYLYAKEEYQTKLGEVRNRAKEFVNGITDDMPDAQKALLIHDRLAANCEYDYDNLMAGTIPFEAYTLYGALATERAVCQGYARAMVYLLDIAGIHSYTCPSDQLNHMWVIAYIDGKKYHIDTTWDDPVLNLNGRALHRNFLVSTATLKQTAPLPHLADDYDETPVSEKYDHFFWENIESAFCLFEGKLYYVDNAKKTIFEYDFDTGNSEKVLRIDAKWMASDTTWWDSNFTKLATDGENLYYSLPEGIYSLDPISGESKAVFTPDMSEHKLFSIYGFKCSDGKLVCQAYATPNITPFTETKTYVYELSSHPEQGEPEIPALPSRGDVSADGIIAVDDALSVLRVAASMSAITEDILKYGDMDADGKITVADALAILRIAAKLA